jgi:hypothetical protein
MWLGIVFFSWCYTKAVFKEILEKIKLRESQIDNELNLDEKCNRESAKVKKLINREKHFFDETVFSKHDVESVLFMTESVGMRFAGFL